VLSTQDHVDINDFLFFVFSILFFLLVCFRAGYNTCFRLHVTSYVNDSNVYVTDLKRVLCVSLLGKKVIYMAKKFYVVWQGRKPGIYTDWPTCLQQVDKFTGARYKSFPSLADAQSAFEGGSSSAGTSSKSKNKSNASSVKTYTAKEVLAFDAYTKIFTDGGCEPNPGEAGSGLALYCENELTQLWYGLYNPMGTNNTAELNALHQALLIAKREINAKRTVAIFCDSKYSIQCVIQWAASWEKKGWKKSGGEIKNLALIQQMFALYQTLKENVHVLHVNGHVGVEGNELADRMSIYAMNQKETQLVRFPEPFNLAELLSLRAG